MDISSIFNSFSIDLLTDFSLKQVGKTKYAKFRSVDAARQSRCCLDNNEIEVK